VEYAKEISSHAIAIDAGSERQEMYPSTLSTKDFVDFVQCDIEANIKYVAGGLGAHVLVLVAVSEKPFKKAVR